MRDYYQLSLEDVEQMQKIGSLPSRTAFIDEYGGFGFDFSKEGTLRYYVLCAIVVDNKDIDDLHTAVAQIKAQNGFASTELKSSTIGNDYNRRSRILSQMLPINFRAILLIADKQAFIKGSPLTEYKKSFIKYLHQRLYSLLYHVYPKLRILADETGRSEFQNSFREYVVNHRPQVNLLNEYDFDFTDSKDELLVQLADMIGGSIGHTLTDETSLDYIEMLKGKILTIEEFPSKKEPYWGTTSPEACKYDKRIYALAIKCAHDFINKHSEDESDERRCQVALLRFLLFHVQNVNPTRYISSYQLLSAIREYTERRITKNYLYRKVIAPLRDEGVIIASCAQGYKIPISAIDITSYLNQTKARVGPMLHRVSICRQLILQETIGALDVLDDPAFIRYKKYFD